MIYKGVCKLSSIRHRYDNGIIVFSCVGYVILNTFKLSIPSLLFDDFSFLELNTELCLIYFYVGVSKVVTLNIRYLMHIFKFQNQMLLSDNQILAKRLSSKLLGMVCCFAVNCLVILQLKHFSVYNNLRLFDLALPVS